MKTRVLFAALIIAVVVLGFWVARIDASLSEAANQIAAVNKKLETIQHDFSTELAQNMKQLEQTMDLAIKASAPGNEGPAASKEIRDAVAADPKAALALAQGLPPGPDRDGAMQMTLAALAATDPQSAWDQAQNLPDDGTGFRLSTLKSVLAAWSTSDPAKAAAMLATLPATAAQETSISGTNTTAMIEINWIAQDPVAATQWIDTLPPGSTRDSAILGLAAVATATDPATAFSWVGTMATAGIRGTTTTGIVTQWAMTDPDAATAAVMSRYPNNNNGRQATLLGTIAQARTASDAAANSAAANGPPGP